ncbi:hypothetical protein QEZ47_11810 [Aminobacter anthyllidis]|uniref:hypothetical protein n=1 Tax=Aminobacter anthyllidis TaxID=1035067 RepID=UPI002453760F|nr:hypothetical protein [Aminobacter anthyllidis]MDH4986207.1 hypothetical protein [Aminobacter anthyllidis]
MLEDLCPDAARAVAFLSWLNPGATLYLEHMSSDGPVRLIAASFPPDEQEAARHFIADNNTDSQRRNMYWLPNAEFLSDKRAKANLSAARFLHVDLDCKDYPGSEEEQSNRIIGLLTDAGVRPKGVPTRSELVFAASLWMLSRAIKPGHVVSILTDSNFGISAHVLERPDSLRYAQRQVLKAMESLAAHRTEGDGASVITLWPGFMPQIVDAAELALMREEVGIYQRFDALVRVVRLVVGVDEEGVGRDGGALILKPVSMPWLKEQFARVARWEKPSKKGGTVRINPPSDAATAYLARVGEWKLRFLQGITQSPTLRADGTVLICAES